MKKKTSVEEFADNLEAEPEVIIAWAESEIREYNKLIKILKKKRRNK